MRWYFKFFFSFYLVCAVQMCLGQKIIVRVVDSRNGHPLPEQQISISFLYGENGKASQGKPLLLQTDAEGQAFFSLPEPLPQHLSAQVHLSSHHWRCGCAVLVSTQDLIQKGAVGAESQKPASGAAKAGPGEIVFVARPLGFFERLLYPLVKG